MCAHNYYSTWLIRLNLTRSHWAYISQIDCSSRTHASKHEHILTHAHTVSRDTQAYVSEARSFWLAIVQKWTQLTCNVSSVCYPSKSVFPAQDVSDDIHPELSASTSAFSRFSFSFLLMRVFREKRGERRVTRRRGRSSENNLIRTAMVPTAAPDEPGLAGITMLVTDTSSTTGIRFFPSFIDSLLPVILLSFLTVLRSRLPHLLPSYLFTFSLSLVPSDKVH